MNKRVVSLILVFIMMFSIFVQPVLALDSITDEITSDTIIETATDSNASKESNKDDTSESHSTINTEENKVLEDVDSTNNMSNDETLKNINQETDLGLLDKLDDLFDGVFTESNANELENVKDIEENLENLSINDNISAIIPDNSINVLDDLGIIDGFVADIYKISTFSLRGSNNVTLKTPQYEDGTELSVIHFIESVYHISDDSIVLNVSDYSNSSKELLEPAITAYQEYFETSDECVAIEIFDTTVEESTISFETSSFSIFAIGQAFLNTFEFYIGDELVNTQYIIGNSNGEGLLLEPEAPTNEDTLFKGWKIEGTNEYQEFGIIKVNMSKHTTIKLYADIEKTYHVYFYYEAREGADILETLSGKPGDVIYTDKVDYPINLDKHVISWHTDIECTSKEITSVEIESQNIILYPKVKTGYWVTFYTEGGSYINSMFYATDDSILPPKNPTKTGYKFAGWIDEDGNEFVFNNQILNKSTILTAKWEPQIVNYTVQFVAQSTTNPEQYNPVASALFTKEALVGTTISGSTITQDEIDLCIENLAPNAELKEFLECFELNTIKTNNESIVVQADGSSVIYVYYDRFPFVFNFYINDETIYTTYTKLFNAEITMEEWPILTEEEYPGFSSWLLYDDRNTVIARLDAYSLDNVVFDGEKYVLNLIAYGSQTTNWKAYYYFQSINPDGTVPDVGYTLEEHVQYIESVDLLNPDNPLNEGNEAIKNNWTTEKIDSELGVTSDVTVNGNWILEDIFEYGSSYPAVSYSADAYNGFTPIAFMGDYYENIDGKNSSHKGPYIRVPEWDYYGSSTKLLKFGGYVNGKYTSKYYDGSNPLESGKWYLVSDAIQITFKGHLYIRYLRNHYDLVFKVGNEIIDEFEVYYETDLGLDKFKTPETKLNAPLGYKFGGWFTSETYSEDTRFELDNHTMPANDLVLYAKWIPTNVELDVHITIDGVDEIIEGFNGFTVKYGDTVSREQVNSLKPNVNMPENAIWYGWYEKIDIGGTEPLMVPFNFDKQLIEDLVLYPFYSYMDPTKVFYDLNGGSGTTPVDIYNYAVGKGAVVLDCPDIVAPEGKVFLGWNTKADGTGLTFRPNDIMRISEKNPVLYALYGDIPDGPYDVNIKYINTVSGEEVIETYQLYNTVFIKDQNVFTIPIHRTYIFKEFNTKSDGTGISFSPNDEVYLTTEGENILYAIYEKVNSASINIPIIKHFKDFQPTDELFTINGYLSNETGDLLSEQLGVICFKYQGNEAESMNLEMVLDLEFFEPNNDYYIKIFENPGESMILYDNNYYLVKFTMENITPTILSIEKYRKDGEIIESFEFEGSLEFTNVLTLEADRLPDMGGYDIFKLNIVGLIFIFIGFFILFLSKKQHLKN